MKSALIITSLINDAVRLRKDLLEAPYDMIICCDGGTDRAAELCIKPDIIIGDFDSAESVYVPDKDSDIEVVTLPHEKDVTDTEAACDLAFSRGAGVMTIAGGLGGRFDHTMANIGVMSKYLGKADIFIIDGDNFIRMLAPGKHMIVSAGYTYLGLIAYGGPVKGLIEKGTLYELEGYDLSPSTSFAVSNEIVSDPAVILFEEGQLLVIQSDDALPSL